MSALGHSLPIQFAPEFSNVRYGLKATVSHPGTN